MQSLKSNCNIDDEWQMFLSGNMNNGSSSNKNSRKENFHFKKENNEDSDLEYDLVHHDLSSHNNNNNNNNYNNNNYNNNNYNNNNYNNNKYNNNNNNSNNNNNNDESLNPKCTPIYISTKTNIAYLNTPIDIKNVFWEIPIISYSHPGEGVIKKQIKLNSLSALELKEIQTKLSKEKYFEEHIITHIDNTNSENSYNDHSKRIIFKDIRKISIGLSKKDIMSYRNKKKSAFYNCFVLILRLKTDEIFKEFHVKVFNTGKLEIPGIQKEADFQRILNYIIVVLKPFIKETTQELNYKEGSTETVLINSNFNCGYYINREIFYDILKYKYNIQSIYDPCSYPGIQCKFYFNPDIQIQSGSQISENNKDLYKNVIEVSFMVFRTGSVLIVGKCDENVLFKIYDFLKVIFQNEYEQIGENLNNTYSIKTEEMKKKKIRKKIMYSNTDSNYKPLE